MGIHTMSSQRGGDGQRPQIQGLGRQGSIYSLTLNEVQSYLGESLNSMNLDELLKTVFPADANQSPAMNLDRNAGQYASGSNLQRQERITMPQSLSKKTVDQVWRDIQQGQKKCSEGLRLGQERKMTLGEMTLEDFLVKAGVVSEDSGKNKTNLVGNVGPVGATGPIARAQWLCQYNQTSSMNQQQALQNMMGAYMPGYAVPSQKMMGAYMPGYAVPQQMGVDTSPILDTMYFEGQMNLSPLTPRRKRAASGDIGDKLVERRQKRMIKNRESASRSRVKKHAHTHELENRMSLLEVENEKMEKQKKLDEILYVPKPEPKFQLRRTSSALF